MSVEDPKIFVAGHKGMAGSAIVRRLLAQGHPSQHLLTRTHVGDDQSTRVSANSRPAAFAVRLICLVYTDFMAERVCS